MTELDVKILEIKSLIDDLQDIASDDEMAEALDDIGSHIQALQDLYG